MALQDAIKAAEKLRNKEVKALISQLSAVPEGTQLKRLSANCFVVNSSALRENWSVEFHDNKMQVDVIIKALPEKQDLQSIYNMLQCIVTTGKCTIKGHPVCFNQQVRDHIKQLL